MLRCTGRAYPPAPIRARPRRPVGADRAVPVPGLPRIPSYYVDVARSLHAGTGFNVDFIWIFAEVGGAIPADPTLPIPSNAHWMPLASIVQVPFMALFGDVAWASALPFALIGAIAAPLTWAIARDVGARSSVAVGAGILTAIPLLSAVYLVQPDNFSLFQPLVIGVALARRARALRGSSTRAFVGAGLLAGLATLSRNDGLLVLAALGLVVRLGPLACLAVRSARAVPAISFAAAAGCVAVFVLVMAPWWARQLAVFGSLSPSTASGKVLFIRVDRGVEQHHDAGHARSTCSAWASGPLLGDAGRRAWSPR